VIDEVPAVVALVETVATDGELLVTVTVTADAGAVFNAKFENVIRSLPVVTVLGLVMPPTVTVICWNTLGVL
jgi:hypothetical protein